MADLKTLKIRINSIKKTQKITKAMKMVAASKLRKARQNAESSRLYNQSLNKIMHTQLQVSEELFENRNIVSGADKEKNILLVIISSDRGLCGGINTNLSKFVLAQIKKHKDQGLVVSKIFVGRKSSDYVQRFEKNNILLVKEGFSSRKITVNEAKELTQEIIKLFKEEKFDICKVIYPKFKTAISQEMTETSLIPCEKGELVEESSIEYDYEPKKAELLEYVAEKRISSELYQSFLECFASEQGARMTAMDSAVNNCTDLIKTLSLKYNRTRQAKITTELVEIIASVESL